MEIVVYKPNPDQLRMRQIFGSFFALSGGGLGCLFFVLGLLVLPFLGNPTEGINSWLLGLIIPGSALAVGLTFVLTGTRIALSGRNDRVQLTPDSLTYRHGQLAITLPLSDIIRLESRWERGRHGQGRWELVIFDRAGRAIELDIPYGVYLAPFDVRPLLRDLLSRLPGPVEMDLRLQNYVATGQMKW